ncbi:4'-phosphopantetheinyl transferase [Robbsia andropogonis]|uniref:Holo-[acyl-carrier-protein] synthase n=1 Tax=Robbsia andropogonis TaxID=28092 RepID=A0A0F5K2B3_9BURK|nr:holo-ACP synthase [Robbsia andropogonis]KKB64060.1 4'-phosphopantetheinyl transferase [Robbsia andropogonis]MCP1120618.1 holo-ACP synthase [Robbsia andropogonis]MCP1128791.1 holo-ACP synthase [Robbsia andropogonis]
MIFGIGSDIIDIRRVAATMERTGGRFVEKVLGPQEIAIYEARRARSAARGLAFLSTRFAAKEAFSKAIGLGIHMPMTWRAMQTLNRPGGAPIVQTSGALSEWVDARGLTFHVTLSDERDYAIAYVIAEQRDKEQTTHR